MSITSFTGDEKHTGTLEQRQCLVSLTNELQQQFTFLSVLNIVLSITAFLGNALILVALQKDTSLHPPSKLLLRCLATTDLCVGLILEPVYVIHLMSVPYNYWNLCRYALLTAYIVSYILCPVTLFITTAIRVDRLLALSFGLRYRQVVTLKLIYVMIVTFWAVSFLAGTLYLANTQISIWFGGLVISFCVITSIVSYVKIFFTLRQHQTQVLDLGLQQQQPSQASPLNIARHRKAVSSILWVQFTVVVCYLPYGIVGTLASSDMSSTNVLALSISVTLVYLNSTLNPFLYCWKISEVKQAVKQTITDALCG